MCEEMAIMGALKYHEYAMLYMWSFLYEGATIWFWSGGGGAANFVGTEYSFQHEVGRKIYFQVY